ncbi:MAG: RNA polymerase sigma factor [Clostridia bacterium]|nr:RNA polymerase sigma factor [Clostridia bacterium]
MKRTKLPIETLFPKLMRAASYKTQNDSEAADLVSETVLAALRAEAAGTEITNPEAYLFRTMDNLFHSSLRLKYGISIISSDDEHLYSLSSDEPSVEDTLISREEAEELRREVAFLAKKYREAIVRFYLKGESVDMIADALDLPKGTIKSRLDTGRKTLRKGLTMKNYDTQSYEPKRMSFGTTGSPGKDDSPFQYASDLLSQNIMICAYEKPLSAVEIAKKLGVATCYIEAQLEMLCKAELMKETDGGKYYTDFIMYQPGECEKLFGEQKVFAEKHREAFRKIFTSAFEKLMEAPYLQNVSESVKRSALAFFGINTIFGALNDLGKEVYTDIPFSEFPTRPGGGKWYALGGIISEQPYEYYKYHFSGKASKTFKENGIVHQLDDFDSRFGHTHGSQAFHKISHIGRMLANIANGNFDAIDSYDCEQIPELLKMEILEKEAETVRLAIPYLTKEEMQDYGKRMKDTAGLLCDAIGADFKEYLRAHKITIPDRIRCPEYQLYYPAYDCLVMLFLEDETLYPIPVIGKKSPALVLYER